MDGIELACFVYGQHIDVAEAVGAGEPGTTKIHGEIDGWACSKDN